MPLEERELHVAISEKETCPIHRDWHDEETDFKEKSVRYTEIRHTISHMKSRMRESRTSGSVRGVPCERYVYSTRQKTYRVKFKEYTCVNALTGLYLISTVPLQKPRFYAVSRACICRYLSEYSDSNCFSCMLTIWTYLTSYTHL